MDSPVLQLQDLRAGYGDVPVLRGVSLTVGSGEIVALVGANGAGKTTTLLTVSDLVRATGGAVRGGARGRASRVSGSVSYTEATTTVRTPSPREEP